MQHHGEVWLGGKRRAVVRVAGKARIVRVEIDPEGAFPDLDRRNQVRPGAVDGAAKGGYRATSAAYDFQWGMKP